MAHDDVNGQDEESGGIKDQFFSAELARSETLVSDVKVLAAPHEFSFSGKEFHACGLEYHEIKAATWQAAIEALGPIVRHDTIEILHSRLKAATENQRVGQLHAQAAADVAFFREIASSEHPYASLVGEYLTNLTAWANSVFDEQGCASEDSWSEIYKILCDAGIKELDPLALAMLLQDDEAGCITTMFTMGSGVCVGHQEENSSAIQGNGIHETARLIRFEIGGSDCLAFQYNHLLPGVGFNLQVTGNDITCFADDYLPFRSDKKGLINALCAIRLLHPEADMRQLLEMLGGVRDASILSRAVRRNGKIAAGKTWVGNGTCTNESLGATDQMLQVNVNEADGGKIERSLGKPRHSERQKQVTRRRQRVVSEQLERIIPGWREAFAEEFGTATNDGQWLEFTKKMADAFMLGMNQVLTMTDTRDALPDVRQFNGPAREVSFFLTLGVYQASLFIIPPGEIPRRMKRSSIELLGTMGSGDNEVKVYVVRPNVSPAPAH